MSWFLWLRFGKLVSVMLLFAGTIGTMLSSEAGDRRRFANWLAAPAFLLTWAFGFLLAYVTRASLLATWILGSLGLSLFSINVVLFVAARGNRPTKLAAGLAVVPLLVTLSLMVWR